MKLAGGTSVAAAIVVLLLALAPAGLASIHGSGENSQPRVITDGRLRPGHLETIWLKGFPGKGVIEVSFFPTAICEDECGAASFRGGRTDAKGSAKFQVRVPGTFFDHRNHPVFFRDGERIAVDVTWEGPQRSFSAATAEPEPVIVRTHRSHHG